MFVRYLKAAPLGIAVTFALLYAMQALIEQSAGPALTTVKRFDGIFISKVTEDYVKEIEPKPEPIDPPEPIPTAPAQERSADGPARPYVGVPAQPIVDGPATINPHQNGIFVNTLKVSPRYPVAAAKKGLEGWVIVRFDVSELGLVENITVVESSSSLFNKAATDAVARFRYKPRVVDGVAQPVRGLMNKFVFEMEN